jgi:hypothetical protein
MRRRIYAEQWVILPRGESYADRADWSGSFRLIRYIRSTLPDLRAILNFYPGDRNTLGAVDGF